MAYSRHQWRIQLIFTEHSILLMIFYYFSLTIFFIMHDPSSHGRYWYNDRRLIYSPWEHLYLPAFILLSLLSQYAPLDFEKNLLEKLIGIFVNCDNFKLNYCLWRTWYSVSGTHIPKYSYSSNTFIFYFLVLLSLFWS